jgi:hypothetical protein
LTSHLITSADHVFGTSIALTLAHSHCKILKVGAKACVLLWVSVAIATTQFSNSTGSMGKANQSLKQVLETYSISQNRLTLASGIDRSTLFMWLHEQEEPSPEAIVEIVKALKQINPDAAQQFIQLYLS